MIIKPVIDIFENIWYIVVKLNIVICYSVYDNLNYYYQFYTRVLLFYTKFLICIKIIKLNYVKIITIYLNSK